MPDQRQPDQPIDRNQQSDRQNQQGLQGSQSGRQDQQNLQGSQSDRQSQQASQSDRQNQGLQGSSRMTGGSDRSDRDQDGGLDMSRRESTSSSGDSQQDRMQTRQGQQNDRGLSDDMSRRETTYTDEGLGRSYDTDDMEAQGTSELDEEGFGDSRTRNRDDQSGRNQIDR